MSGSNCRCAQMPGMCAGPRQSVAGVRIGYALYVTSSDVTGGDTFCFWHHG